MNCLSPCDCLFDNQFAGGELDRVMSCKWFHDTEQVVLEMADPSKKSTSDSEVCCWRTLICELEEEGITGATVNSHDLQSTKDEKGP